jgi:hypothetical protein
MPINFALDFTKELDARFSKDAKGMSYSDWVCKNTTLKRKPFNFKRYPFQKAIMDDLHPNLCVIKPSQQGATELQMRKALAFLARNRGTTLMFTFPTEPMLRKQSQTRFQPLIEADRVFSLGATKPIRSIEVNQIGTSFLLLAPATETSATGQPCDVIFNDEVDLSDQHMLALFQSRLQGSSYRITQQFSTPTFGGYGIDATYALSDQQEYMIKCACCNHWQVPVFSKKFINIEGLPDEIELDEIDVNILDKYEINTSAITVDCERCHQPLDLLRDKREWVATYPNRTNNRGYRMRTFSGSTLPPSYVIDQLLKYRKNEFIRGWYNTVLGETYDKGDVRLTDAILNPLFKSERGDASPIGQWYFGADVGSVCHIVIGSSEGIRKGVRVHHFETVLLEKFIDRLIELREKYPQLRGMMDQYPEQWLSKSAFELSGGAIIPCGYRGSIEIADKTETTKNVQVDRTEHLDSVARLCRGGLFEFFNFGNQKELIKEHLKDMVRDVTPEKPAVWRKLTGQDHYFHALAFLTTAVKYFTNDFTGYREEPIKTTLYLAGQDIQLPQGGLYGRESKKKQADFGYSGLLS